ncbi:ferritin-like domain-containing protein [Sphingomonas oligophenolica]|uniref:Ferritin-like domain-containing protein n=2 Tax=Sphingomonas oligophenolica TaxID=301154 RepID=A0A502C8Z8_9SPHN|nr:ferritin-like domain-containing protein [Sphingomonas oligophenolica]
MISTPAAAANLTDNDILNFALNLEYLEAEYYLRGVMGRTLDEAAGGSFGGTVRGGRKVNFTSNVRRGFIEDITRNELAHVLFLRSALGANAIQRPTIDFDAGFQGVAQAAGLAGFDPFADETSFWLGAFLFEDVGVTAYKAAANLIHDQKILTSAAGILAAEAYHAGVIRSVIVRTGGSAITASTAMSDVRDTLDGGSDSDQPVMMDGRQNLVPADENSIAFGRTPQQVHNIVFANPAAGVTRGGFFPDGTNGKLVSS